MTLSTTEVHELPQEHIDFRDTIRQIVRERVAPRAAEIDAKAEYPWDIRRLFAEQDILGLPLGVEHGGAGTGTLMLQVAVEEIAKACASSALILMVQELGTLPITLFGVADFYVVFAMTDREQRRISAFVVDKDTPGLSIGKLEHKLGIKGSTTGSPVFEDVRVPAGNLVGTEGKGMSFALATLERTRLGAAAQAVQVLGGYGYVTDYPVERMMRDAKITQIYEGTNEIQRLVIARAMK